MTRWLLVGLVAMLLLPARWATLSARQDALDGHDFGVFTDGASAYLFGGDPYRVPGARAPNLLPPHALVLLFGPFVPLDRSTATRLWTLIGLLSVWGSAWLILRTLQIEIRWWQMAILGLVLASSGLLVSSLLPGNVYLVLMPLMTLAWRWWRQDRPTDAALLIGAVATVKVLLVAGIGALALAGRWTWAWLMALTVLAVFLGGMAQLEPAIYRDWLLTLQNPPVDGQFQGASIWQSLRRLTGEPGQFAAVVDWTPATVRLVWVILSSLVGLVAIIRWPSDPDKAVLVLVTTSALVAPIGWHALLWWTAGPVTALALSDRTWRPILVAIGLTLWLVPETGPRWGQPSVLGTLTLGMLYPAIMGTLWVGGLFGGRSVSSTSSRHPHGVS